MVLSVPVVTAFVVLAEDELALGGPAHPALPQLAEDRVELAVRTLVQAESLHGVLEDIG